MSKQQQTIWFSKIGADKLIDHRIAVTKSNIKPTPNSNNNITKYEKKKFKLSSI